MYEEQGRKQEVSHLLDNIRIHHEKRIEQEQNQYLHINLIKIYTLLGENEKVLKYLLEGSQKYGAFIMYDIYYHNRIPHHPIYKLFWNDPEFKSLINQINRNLKTIRDDVDELRKRGEIDIH